MIFLSDLKGNLFNLLRKFRRKWCNAEDAELRAINFCCAEDAQICAYKKTCCVGNPRLVQQQGKAQQKSTFYGHVRKGGGGSNPVYTL